ncbi:MAG TPA: putative toxin-antitoxin system toxin component, PIN family [Chthoniobacterales bacterium]|nr:putative toxin-antitoxin system toxin component, PIN family [Chthoniobacterales bacterium]
MTTVPSWVLDTNVLVSGLLNSDGPPGRLIDAVLAGALRITYDDRIEREYRRVLARPKFAIPDDLREAILGELKNQDAVVAVGRTGRALPDPDDLPFLEAAYQATDQVLGTGNRKHYPARLRRGVLVLTPADAWQRLTAR